MAETHDNGVSRFLANGGGAITFRLLATAMGALLIWLVRMEGEQLNERLNRIEAAITAASELAQTASAHGDVNAARLGTLDNSAAELWRAINAADMRLDDHEHRISELEGAHRR